MVNLFFFLRFKSQLRKTRPDIVRKIDESLIKAITDAGGKITGERFVISAVFNEETIGFWLDMFILIENVKNNIDASSELFGFSLVICNKQPEPSDLFCRSLSSYSGVFVDEKAAKKLFPYVFLEKPSEWMKNLKKQKFDYSDFYRIKEYKVFKPANKSELNFHNEVTKIFEQEKGKNILILGPSYWQIRSGLYKFGYKLNGDFPSLVFSFDSIGLGSLVDVWSLNIRSLVGGMYTEEIDNLWEFLYRERIRSEVSEYANRCITRFLLLIIDLYIDAAHRKRKKPVLMLENIHLAEKNIMILLLGILEKINPVKRKKILLLGTGEDSIKTESLNLCESVFDYIKKIKNTKIEALYYPSLSIDLWEIIYAISLFNRYFSPEFIHLLFEEDKKNPAMITRAFSILHSLSIIDSIREPRLIKNHYEEYAVKILENKTYRIKAMVYERLLNWAVKRNIIPCFNLLSVISGLETRPNIFDSVNLPGGEPAMQSSIPGGIKQIDDLLLLKSILSDIVNKTVSSIEIALTYGQFEDLLAEKTDTMRQVYLTSLALNTGSENDINKAFNSTQMEYIALISDAYPVLKAQLIVNHCIYYLGSHEEKKAAEKAKEAILMGQNRNSYCLPQAYRLYSLVCLSKQQINETIEYLGFALSNAEKSNNHHELTLSAYYAAAAYFLYGDIFKAARLTQKSIEYSLSACCPDWGDRARFLEGRIKFELGNYKEAHDIFDKLFKEPYGSMTYEKENLLAAWIYRCKIYFKNPDTPKPDVNNNDADLFEIEAAYLAGNYRKAIDLSASYVNLFKSENYLFIEQADWRSGFAQCEHLYFSNGEIQNRMVSLFHSLALSSLYAQESSADEESEESENGREEAIQGIQKILRYERLCEMDPWDAFYFYAKYRILEQCGASLVDKSTAVSMAFKRLQRRACRIEDVETRHQYLNGPLWNRELNQAAKEFKLI